MIFATNPITEDQYSKIKARWNNISYIQKTWLAFLVETLSAIRIKLVIYLCFEKFTLQEGDDP